MTRTRRNIYDPSWDIGHSHAVLVEAMSDIRQAIIQFRDAPEQSQDGLLSAIVRMLDSRCAEAGFVP
jgi:ribosome maturation protein Sdo1